MTSYIDAGSDLDMLSQTENEDTDMGEVSAVSDASLTPSSAATDSSLELKREISSPSTKQSRPKLVVNVSADLTDVTDLEENTSSVEDNGQRTKVKHTANDTNKETGIPKIFPKDNWYNQKCFESYWNHYNQVMSWCGKHFQVYNNLTSKTSRPQCVPSQVFDNHNRSSQGKFDCFPQSAYTMFHPYSNFPSSTNNVPISGHQTSERRKRKAKHRKIKSECCSEETVTETGTESSEVIEMEVTQDMIDFYAKTMEHRLQRDKERKAEEFQSSTQPGHVNVEDVKVSDNRTPTVEAPKERPGARRTAEMKLLYGKGAAMIHGMETALQMTFDRNMDVKQPKMWPNMPLRVVFA